MEHEVAALIMVAPSFMLTREDLYERIWRSPMKAIAQELGVSPNQIKVMCVRLKVPTPPRGHWRAMASGKDSTKHHHPLPPISRGELRSILVRRRDEMRWTPQETQLCEAAARKRAHDKERAHQRHLLEVGRKAVLKALSERSDEADRLKRFLQRIENLDDADVNEAQRAACLAWVQTEIKRLDPLSGGIGSLYLALDGEDTATSGTADQDRSAS